MPDAETRREPVVAEEARTCLRVVDGLIAFFDGAMFDAGLSFQRLAHGLQ